MKKIFLEIERLVLPQGSLSGPAFARLLEREIASVLAGHDSLAGIKSLEAPRIAGGKISMSRNMPQEKLAQSIAKAVCHGMAGKKGRHG
jgi:hypothetical protein